MRQLAMVANEAEALELLQRLADAEIEADTSRPIGIDKLHAGGTDVVVWVLHAADYDRALPVLEQFQADAAALRSAALCHRCGYDLRGHGAGPDAVTDAPSGAESTGRCPECGEPFRLPAGEAPCPHCGELVPINFDLCWNCEREIA
jgi:hypothetical protein